MKVRSSRRHGRTISTLRALTLLAATVGMLEPTASVAAESGRPGGAEHRPPGSERRSAGAERAGAAPAAGLRAILDPETGRLVTNPSRDLQRRLAARSGPRLERSMTGLRPFALPRGGRGVNLQGRFQSAFRVNAAQHAAAGTGASVAATLRLDATLPLGSDPLGRLRLYAPDPVDPGSSISHWDTTAHPDLLMEPFIGSGTPIGELDLTLELLRDLGWSPGEASIVVHFEDAQGEGFFTPGSIGTERRNAMQHVAQLWGRLIASEVPIHLAVSFDELECASGAATLAQAGPMFIFESFPGADLLSTWYPGALAEALSGENLSLQDDIDPDAPDLQMMFNTAIDEGCLSASSGFHYGVSGETPAGKISFVDVALHEMAHGLGFVSLVNESTGANPLGLPDIFSYFLRDGSNGLLWHQMTDAGRAASAKNTGRLVWDGPNANGAAPAHLSPSPVLAIDAPASVRGLFEVATAVFGPPLSTAGVSGSLAAVAAGGAAPRAGCGPLTNAAEVNGRIALVDRGGCDFVAKVKYAQNAGAAGVVIVNDQPGPPVPMGGSDASISIPSVMIRQEDGALLSEALGGDADPPPPPPPSPTPQPPAAPAPTPTPPPTNAPAPGSPSTLEPSVSNEPPSGCMQDAGTLCLESGRFRIRATWRTRAGATGAGKAVPLTSDSGYFWFFDPANVEVVLKVKNACVEPFQHYWFFAAGLTDVEATIEVKDTQTGRVLTYRNPLGQALPPIQDTDAFATCP